MNNIFLFGLLGHVLGDYYFQSGRLSSKKETSMRAILTHCLLYCVPFLLLSFFSVKSLRLYVMIFLFGLCHMAIDVIKYLLSVCKNSNIRKALSNISVVFVTDQILHISSIFLLALIFSENWEIHCIPLVLKVLSQTAYNPHAVTKGILIVLLILKPVNIAFTKLFYTFRPPIQKASKEMMPLLNPKLSYLNAGEVIGCLERLIIVMFLSMNQYSAIGFVLTAKSVARYDDIAHNKQFAEYFLIGTLYSSAASMVVYWVVSIL